MALTGQSHFLRIFLTPKVNLRTFAQTDTLRVLLLCFTFQKNRWLGPKIGEVFFIWSALSDSPMSEDAGIEPKTDTMFALAVRRSYNSARSDLSANGKLRILQTECIQKKTK